MSDPKSPRSSGLPEARPVGRAFWAPTVLPFLLALLLAPLLASAGAPLAAQDRDEATARATPRATPGTAPASPVHFDLQAHRLGGMRAQVATLLVQGGHGGGIATEVLAVPVDSAGEGPGERLVPVLIEIEGPTLLSVRDEESESVWQRVEVYAYALTPQGAVQDFLTQTVRLDLELLGEQIYSGGLKLVGSLSLPPGQFSLRVLVMDADSGQYGLRSVPLIVPDASAAVAMLLAPLVAEPPGSWLLVRQDVTPETPLAAVAATETAADRAEGADDGNRRGDGKADDRRSRRERRRQQQAAAERQEAATEPAEVADPGAEASRPEPIPPETAVRSLLLGRQRTLPSAFPLFDSGATVEAHLLAFGLGNDPKITAKLTPQDGGEPHVIPMQVLARLGTDDPKMERISGRFTVPNLPTGAFLLSFAAEMREGTTETSQVRALVLEENPLGEPLVWGQLRSAAAEIQRTARGEAAPAPELDLPRRKKKRASALEQAVQERYARALSLLGTGSTSDEVVEALVAMEREIFSSDPGEGLPAINRGEMTLARLLAETEPEALVPLIGFHLDLYLHYRRERDFALATHSRHTAIELADLYAKSADSQGAQTIASQALTTLATEMLDAGLRNAGGSALEEALKLDETNEAARLQLAAHYERLGNYKPAVDTLRKLVNLNPKSAEGRLRLALNLKRTGETRQAEQALRLLVSESNPPWTLTVAYTELANLYLEQRRVGAAVHLLRQAVDRLPDQDRLYIQLAYALDRQRQFLEARRVLARLAARDHHLGNGSASPRHRYARGTEQGLEEARERIVDAARTRQPLLSATLGKITGKTTGSSS